MLSQTVKISGLLYKIDLYLLAIKKLIMNQEQKGQRYSWLLEEHKRVERQIHNVPKRPLEETLQDLDSREYTPENQTKINQLNDQLKLINLEVKKLF